MNKETKINGLHEDNAFIIAIHLLVSGYIAKGGDIETASKILEEIAFDYKREWEEEIKDL